MLLVRLPAGRVPGLDTGTIHLIDFFETEAFGFWNAEPHVDEPERKHAEEDEQDEWPNTAGSS
jgi:hypothetical protein